MERAAMALLTIIGLDGAVFAAILFLTSAGLTLIFGVLRLLNVAHGGIYAFGAYMGTFLALGLLGQGYNPYWSYLMLLVGALIVGLTFGPINVRRIYTLAFTLGTLCAAVGGALIAPTISVVPGFAVDVTVLAFAVIAIGGMGSLEGAALGALIVGLARALAIHLLPELELVAIYLMMVLVLVIRPQGLFGEVELRRI